MDSRASVPTEGVKHGGGGGWAARRSRLEVIGDILTVISEGASRPTQIMQKANVTWPDLIRYLEALSGGEMLTRERDGNRAIYRLTAKGFSLLNVYMKLKEEIAPIEFEAVAHRRAPRVLIPSPGARHAFPGPEMRSRLESFGFKTLDNEVQGESGVRHAFSLVAQGPDGTEHAFVGEEDVWEQTVVQAFVVQLDTDSNVYLLYSGKASEEAKRLAATHSIELIPVGEVSSFLDSLALLSLLPQQRRILLEIDPSTKYGELIRALVEQEERGSDIFVFTWKGSPVYRSLQGDPRAMLGVMTTSVSRATAMQGSNEMLIPQHDEAALLEPILEPPPPDRTRLVIFDSVSELLASFGTEGALEFLREVLSRAVGPRSRYLFLVKHGFHEGAAIGEVASLFPCRLIFGRRGLEVGGLSGRPESRQRR